MSFLNPLFFWGMLAASVPVLLHLIRRERARKVEFPSLMYLRKVSKRTIRYQKLRHLLLLLLRLLAFLLLGLAFTRPFHPIPQVRAATGKVTTAHVILLDDSLSMSYGDRWALAKKAAAGIIREAEPGDLLALLEFSDRVTARSQLIADKASILDQLEHGVLPTDQPTRYGQALKVAEKLALEAGTGKRVIHLISDFQKSGWSAEEQDSRISSLVEIRAVDLGSDKFSNITFGDVQVIEEDENAGGGFKIKAKVVNFGTEERKGVRTSLQVDGRVLSDKLVDLQKSAAQGVEFQIPGLTAGIHSIVLEVDDPNLTRDNRFNMTLEAKGKTPVLSIENPSSGRGGRPPSLFLMHALNISTLSPYRLTALSPQKAESLGSFGGNLVIWNNLPAGSPSIQKKLQEFVKEGGGLAIVLADAESPADFNNSFGAWVPVKIEETASRQTTRPGQASRPVQDYALLTDARMEHQVFRPFSEPHSGSFSTAKFFQYARVAAGQGSEVLARFDNGYPALVSADIGKGRIVVFSSSADDKWNDLPLKPVYAPFWQQTLRYLNNLQEGRRWVDVGETIAPQKILREVALRQGKGNVDLDQALVVLDPGKERVPITTGSKNAVTVERIGFYELRTTSLNTSLAVNAVPRESDLTHANAEEVLAGLTSQATGAPQVVANDEILSPEEQERRKPLWRLILAAVLVFLLSEGLLANRLALKPD